VFGCQPVADGDDDGLRTVGQQATEVVVGVDTAEDESPTVVEGDRRQVLAIGCVDACRNRVLALLLARNLDVLDGVDVDRVAPGEVDHDLQLVARLLDGVLFQLDVVVVEQVDHVLDVLV